MQSRLVASLDFLEGARANILMTPAAMVVLGVRRRGRCDRGKFAVLSSARRSPNPGGQGESGRTGQSLGRARAITSRHAGLKGTHFRPVSDDREHALTGRFGCDVVMMGLGDAWPTQRISRAGYLGTITAARGAVNSPA